MNPNDVLQFIRQRDYRFVEVLGQGACGQTVLLHDDDIDEYFVCKKFTPYDEAERGPLFEGFVREIKILHLLLHRNVVRVFNYYIYRNELAGFILMEHVKGQSIDKHVATMPETASELFVQAISGFRHLEASGVLHRDIRPDNLLVTDASMLKIIDFGFGKRVVTDVDFDKSVSLNWWCEPPHEFAAGLYDHSTEVYFVGQLFRRLIEENGLGDFAYPEVLEAMCKPRPAERITSFAEVEQALASGIMAQDDYAFSEDDKDAYRTFASLLSWHISKIEAGAEYAEDPDVILNHLESAHRRVSLEEEAPTCMPILGAFIHGGYFFRKTGFPTEALADFIALLKSATPEQRRIVVLNLHNRLDAIQRYDDASDARRPDTFEDDIPF